MLNSNVSVRASTDAGQFPAVRLRVSRGRISDRFGFALRYVATFGKGGMHLGTKKLYRKPVLQVFGDIGVLTRLEPKDAGFSDGFIFLQTPLCQPEVNCAS